MADLIDVLSPRPYALVIHGGAGAAHPEDDPGAAAGHKRGLRAAYAAGEAVLDDGGTALDAVCAAVTVFEDDPWFNSGRGAALTSRGTVEHDAAIMTGDGRGGAVTLSRRARHPVLLARAVMERSPHVLLADPPDDLAESWGLELMDNAWFVTDRQRAHLARLQTSAAEFGQHGTVGAVALDREGHLAAATSTGGIENQAVGRIGDTPILGAGTWARDGVVAVSCTGHGEAFILGGVAHQLSGRIEYGGEPAGAAARLIIDAEIAGRTRLGALIAVTPDRHTIIAWHAPLLLAAWRDDTGVRVHS